MKIAVYIAEKADPVQEGEKVIFEGFLTDESSACFGGIPVLIDKDGNIYGTNDIRNMGIMEPLRIVKRELTDEDSMFCNKAAGAYPIEGLSS
ncbi:MAG: hypothetical protein A4E64_00102 [Syntrophorhabdus sp. PtaU1.Bin058]|nr:MAG: hypothetical protein A4E64_00102 [Syntrophorhabdus sp. PtaU1.Bin058]